MIQSHLYANKKETRLYSDRVDNGELICLLHQGDWLGVLQVEDGWFKVLTIHGEGWVKSEDAEERSPFNLHVQWTPGKPIEYISNRA